MLPAPTQPSGRLLAPIRPPRPLSQPIEHSNGRHHLVAGRQIDAVHLALEAAHRTRDLVGRGSQPPATIDRRARELQPLLGFSHGLPRPAGLITAGQCGVEPKVGREYGSISWPAGACGPPTPTPAQGSATDAGHEAREQRKGSEAFEPAGPTPG